MTPIEQAIKEAVEKGGYRNDDPMGIRYADMIGDRIFLDKEFWEALEKSQRPLPSRKCKLSKEYLTNVRYKRKKRKQREGDIVGESRDKQCWLVRWDGMKRAKYRYAKEFIETDWKSFVEENWFQRWHRFIDHLAEGKDANSFFANLK